MIGSMFAGVAGLRTHQNRMNVIGHNIANVNTVGYKSARGTFMEAVYQNSRSSSQGTNVMGGTNPSQIGFGSLTSSIDVNYSTGSYEPTGYGTDCFIDGGGFFLVGPKMSVDAAEDGISNEAGEANQASQLMLTRVGKFNIDGDGYLVDSNGYVVYGFMPEQAAIGTADLEIETTGEDMNMTYAALKPIRIQENVENANEAPNTNYEEDIEILNLSGISIDKGGILSGKGSNNVVYKCGIVAVCNVPNPNALEKTGNSYYKVVNNTGDVQAFQPGSGTTGGIINNGIEMANVDLATEFSSMILTQRGFQANSKIITVSDEMLQELINMKR